MSPDDFRVLVAAMVAVTVAFAYLASTWMRIKHGYPIESRWGRTVYPVNAGEAEERVRLLTQENAQLRAELGAIRDRLGVVERIVTDGAYRLDREIEGLRGPAN